MEQLLFLLFVLFSVGSALLERRKRKLARRREEEAAQRGEQVVDSEEEDQPWSFPPTDPFELEPPPGRISTEELERQALEAAQHTQELEERARQLEQQAHEVVPRRRVEELVRESLQHKQTRPAPARSGGWSISAAEARRGIIYAEILGQPKAVRRVGD